MSFDAWVIDATHSTPEGTFCFCPLEEDGSVLVGVSVISTTPPEGSIVGIFHAGGNEAAAAWIDENGSAVESLGLAE